MKKLFFTALVAAVAIGGAYAGNAGTSKAFLIPAGPQFSSEPECGVQVDCNFNDEFQCTIGSVPYYGQDDSGECVIELFRPTPN